MTKIKPSLSIMNIGRQSQKATRTSFKNEKEKVGAESVAKVQDVADATTAVSGALQPDADSALHMLEVATIE